MKIHKLLLTFLFSSSLFLCSCREKINVVEPKEILSSRFSNITLQITSPSKWELWRQQKTYSIKWSFSTNSSYVFLKIELTKKGKVKFIISENTNNDGEYEWNIPVNIENSNMYQIKISNLSNPNIYALSDEFSIRNF